MSHDPSPSPAPSGKAAGAELQTFVEHNSGPGGNRSLHCRTVATGLFQQLNQIRDLPPQPMEQRTGKLPDGPRATTRENAPVPTPAEAMLAALGSCVAVGIQANAVARSVPIRGLTLDLEAHFDPTAAWGLVNAEPQRIGFSAVRITAHVESDAPREVLEALLKHAVIWSPASNTFYNPVQVEAVLGA